MLSKERLGRILRPIENLLRRDAPWGEVINAGVKASQELQTEIIPVLPYEMPRLRPDPAELELLGKKQLDFNNQNSL